MYGLLMKETKFTLPMRHREVIDVISLCYSTLQPRLKSFFLYGALFPSPSKIPCRKLIRLGIAEGFIDEKKDMTMEEEDIASFKDLQTLAGVKLTKRIGENLKELQQVQKLSVGKVKSNLLNQLAISINIMESLRSLTIKCDLGEQILARSFTSLIEIRTLRIEGEVLDMPGWIKNLKSLTPLELRDCVLKHDPFVALANMSNLVCRSVQNAYVGESIRFPKDCFPRLKKLSIADFQALSQWHMDDGALENLEKFTIGSCPKLTSLPPHFKKLAHFRVMQVRKMPQTFVMEAKQLGENNEKISVVVHGSYEAQFHSTTIIIRRNGKTTMSTRRSQISACQGTEKMAVENQAVEIDLSNRLYKFELFYSILWYCCVSFHDILCIDLRFGVM
ncbi:hypothetical protein L6164_025885 [Bauhinia variegata]|uniref:Uncharacterized protein n=1 Tax=Bauhinia variegata TaxID=167791 RepID=A0ACB9M4Z2_BAUVA|nr:hypothetical protein L6164_025885 [Bauhinia variegata]